jgi:hypothetical protein
MTIAARLYEKGKLYLFLTIHLDRDIENAKDYNL